MALGPPPPAAVAVQPVKLELAAHATAPVLRHEGSVGWTPLSRLRVASLHSVSGSANAGVHAWSTPLAPFGATSGLAPGSVEQASCVLVFLTVSRCRQRLRLRRGQTVSQRHRRGSATMRRSGDGASEPMTLALKRRLNELATIQDGSSGPRRWERLGDCEVIVPEGQFPWGIVFFLGGALLGQYPRLCYDALLRPLADRTGCSVVAVPYEVDTDHGLLALDVQRRFGVALKLAEDRYGWNVERMPTFALGHSLGAKLHVIRHCSENEDTAAAMAREPLAVMAFNNFGLTDSLALAKEALSAFQGGGPTPPGMDALWGALEPMARRAAASAGLEFNPGPEEMEEMMRAGFVAPSTKVVIFGEDRLDCGEELINATADRGQPMRRMTLTGNHLTPVFLKVADLAGAAMQGAVGNRVSAAAEQRGLEVGDKEQLEALIEELSGWLRQK